ncbi:hypothetical protein GGR88_000675 [Sphingomonas jejuensis]|uniref:DUF2336 domain-containing protein n=1 Tax=Sphingomonas jejuensis TaxID=904715 RepID=A0ABX0XKD9_9SPHN|nr:DUF2336 domain-containing protein [Sphingomonas jejuensis]NJC33201.1 hypothetical protein [Sphingomonas jejuensis]
MASRHISEEEQPSGLVANAARATTLASRGLDLLVRQLATPDLQPPSDYHWTQTRRLVAELVEAEEAAFRARLAALVPPVLLPPLAVPHAVSDPALIAQAFARVEEHRLTTMLRAAGSRAPVEPVASGDAEAAALELALLRADSRRFDPFGDPMLVGTDLKAEDMHRLVWRIAAAARAVLIARGEDDSQVDNWIAVAARHQLSRHDEGEGACPAAIRLATRLLNSDRPLADVIEAALSAARPGLAAALLSRTLGIDHADALAALADVDRAAVLLRAAGLPRAEAVGVLLRLAEAHGQEDDKLVATVDGFDALSRADALHSVAQLQLDPGYRAAITERDGR